MKKPKFKAKAGRFSDSSLGIIELTAGVAGLIATIALLALISNGARAEDQPRGGFQPGARTFNNPFATPPQPGGAQGGGNRPNANFFDEDDGGDEDFFGGDDEGPAFPSPNNPRGGTPGGNTAGNDRGSRSGGRSSGNSISAGGSEAPGGAVANNKSSAIKVNDETGDGSKAVVTDFNFPDAEITDIAKTLGKLTGKNFILDKDVKGKVTIISNSPITVGDAWRAFLTALDMNNFAIIPSGNYLRIARQRDARDKQVKTYVGNYSPNTDALITRVFPLKYIQSEEVARTFRSFMPANSRIIPYEQTNTVIVTDTGSNIAKLAKMLEILDVEGYDAGIEVIPVKFASAAELSKLIDQLIPGTSSGAGPGGPPRFGGAGGGRGFTSRRTKEGGIINTIIADERTNTLIVHANTKGADQVRALVGKLDQKQPVQSGGGKVHVIYLQFSDAEAVANTLNNLSQSTTRPSTPTGPGGGTGVNPTTQGLFEGQIKISPDKSTNALVVTASPGDFVTVQRVVNRLDIPRDEVYVDVTAMEVSLSKTFDFSADIINPSSGLGSVTSPNLQKFILNPLDISGGVLSFATGGTKSFDVNGKTVTVGTVQGLIRLIQTNTKTNVLANPQIIALDNTQATFKSTEKIPVQKSTVTSTGVIQNSFDPQPVELSIVLKPSINKMSNFVRLEVEANFGDLSNRQPTGTLGSAIATLDRTAKTSVLVGDGDTIALGGLTRDKVADTQTKIPVLGDIPVLGWLFKSKNTVTEKSNLLIFLTPRIVRQYEKVRAILDRKLKERDDFIEKAMGGDDPQRGQRDAIIRDLPDIKKLANEKPQTTVSIDEDDAQQPAQNNGSPFSGTTTNPPGVTGAPQAPVPGTNPNPAAPVVPNSDIPPPPPPAQGSGG